MKLAAPGELAARDADRGAAEADPADRQAEGMIAAALARAREFERLKAFITLLPDAVGGEGPLASVPVAVKDNIAVAGVATRTGRLRSATGWRRGMRRWWRGCGRRGRRSSGPPTCTKARWARRPTTRSGGGARTRCGGVHAGGSSGGSGGGGGGDRAAGAWHRHDGVGADTGGLLRGLGMKPTRGLIPVTGLSHLSWTLDTIGPIADGPEMVMRALRVMAGPDGEDVFARTAAGRVG